MLQYRIGSPFTRCQIGVKGARVSDEDTPIELRGAPAKHIKHRGRVGAAAKPERVVWDDDRSAAPSIPCLRKYDIHLQTQLSQLASWLYPKGFYATR